ncbi:MAG: hypothetical protein ACOCUS_05190 [Polyangiales bacterium]
MRTVKTATIAVILTIAGTTGVARAEIGAQLHDARLDLARYDLEGERTIDVLRRLERIATRPHIADADAREARFLRAMAATDLVVAAVRTDDETLLQRVAGAFDVSPDAVAPTLEGELRSLMFGIYAAGARDAVAALEVIESMSAGEAPDWTEHGGLRRDALFVAAAVRQATGADDPVGALAALADDPCDAMIELCPVPYAHFDAKARRAMGALVQARGALDRLARAADGGDPLPRALAPALGSDREHLRGVVLRPSPRVRDLSLSPASPGARPVRADLMVEVSEDRVRWGWMPRVRLDGEGEIVVDAPGTPVLPKTDSLALPRDFRPAVSPVADVREAFEELARAGADRIAFGATPSTPAHVLARVLKSAEEAQMQPAALAGIGEADTLRGVPVKLVRARHAGDLSSQVRVKVRLGGYSLVTPRGSTDLPRVRDEQGLRFDVAGLLARAEAEPIDSAQLDFMTVVSSGPVTAAAFRIAPEKQPQTLVLP